jgi:hypothetical protein
LQNPSVMSAALCALYDVIKANPSPYKNLVPSFTSILKQARQAACFRAGKGDDQIRSDQIRSGGA